VISPGVGLVPCMSLVSSRPDACGKCIDVITP
jgi:hypothetical protein